MLADAAARLLERVATHVMGRPAAILDVGCGVGLLTLAAARRWPDARIVGLDASAAMLSLARQRASDAWSGSDPAEPPSAGRFEWLVADAASMPVESASVDAVVSSFALQFVADREAGLREMWRVLRPGGWLGVVTWLASDDSLAADVEFDEAVYDLGLEDPDAPETPDTEPREYDSLAEARAELITAGFEHMDVEPDSVTYPWSRTGYRDFKERFDERELFESLSRRDRARLLARIDERWASLPDEAFVLRAPLVSVTARRPAST